MPLPGQAEWNIWVCSDNVSAHANAGDHDSHPMVTSGFGDDADGIIERLVQFRCPFHVDFHHSGKLAGFGRC